jgi:hypothetical protein
MNAGGFVRVFGRHHHGARRPDRLSGSPLCPGSGSDQTPTPPDTVARQLALAQLQDAREDDFPEFLEAFRTSATELLQSLPAAARIADLGTVERLAHSLKSAARNACGGLCRAVYSLNKK